MKLNIKTFLKFKKMKTTIKYILLFIGFTANAQLVQETTTYSYDNLNRLIQVVFYDGSTHDYVYDDLGNRIQLNIQVLSIEEETLKNTITVYPNPTSNVINVMFPENLISKESNITIYDINGSLVKNHEATIVNNGVTIPTNRLSTGVYLLKVVSDNKTWSQLFIKK